MLRRRLLGVLSLLSLILCGITVVLWIRSYGQGRTGDTVDAGRVNPETKTFYALWFRSYDGRVEIDGSRHVTSDGDYRYFNGFMPHGITLRQHVPTFEDGGASDLPTVWLAFAFAYDPDVSPPLAERESRLRLLFPYWAAFAASIPVPALWLWRRSRTALRHSRGLCPSCGYDWRATPGRCSECGWREVGGDAK